MPILSTSDPIGRCAGCDDLLTKKDSNRACPECGRLVCFICLGESCVTTDDLEVGLDPYWDRTKGTRTSEFGSSFYAKPHHTIKTNIQIYQMCRKCAARIETDYLQQAPLEDFPLLMEHHWISKEGKQLYLARLEGGSCETV